MFLTESPLPTDHTFCPMQKHNRRCSLHTPQTTLFFGIESRTLFGHQCLPKILKLALPSPACQSAADALQARLRAYIPSVMATADSETSVRRLLIVFHRKGFWFENAFKDICRVCAKVATERMHQKRKKFWKQAHVLDG